jgi:hypothetical protein
MIVVLWVVVGVVALSFIEWGVHRYLMHRPSIRLFRSHFIEHAIEHHGRYYHTFNRESGAGKYLNLTLSVAGTVTGITLISPLAMFSLTGFVVFAVLGVLHAVIWSAIHCELQLNQGMWFASTRVYRALMWHHFLHHQHPTKNFNVVIPLADYILGTAARATAADILEWESL